MYVTNGDLHNLQKQFAYQLQVSVVAYKISSGISR